MDDPRVFFAAERTALAWVRTGIAIMGLGFVVARFGIFLKLVARAGSAEADHPGASLAIGVLLVGVASGMCLLAGAQFWRFTRHMRPDELPPRYALHSATSASFAVGAAGLGMMAYLLT